MPKAKLKRAAKKKASKSARLVALYIAASIILLAGACYAVYCFTDQFFSRKEPADVSDPAINSKDAIANGREDNTFRIGNTAATASDVLLVNSGSTMDLSASASAAKDIKPETPSTFSSFFDSFASDYLIDTAKTGLYRDDAAAAVIFAPEYDWEPAAADVISGYKGGPESYYTNDFAKPLEARDRRCHGSDCLEQKGKKLVYKGKSLALPSEVKGKEIAAVSIGSIGGKWLAGFTLKDGAGYQGRAYYFDGRAFSPVMLAGRDSISSLYPGIFGFGGEESDFLVVYGAYRGAAFHIRDGRSSDISRFFDFRVMAAGFRPEIIRAENGRIVNWYVFSSSLGRPRLIKLWQPLSGEISGETVFQDIFSWGETAVFSLIEASDERFRLLARIEPAGAQNGQNSPVWRVFSDRGFANGELRSLVFNPVPVESGITAVDLADSRLGSASGPCPEGEFYFSADNRSWRRLPNSAVSALTPGDKDFHIKMEDDFYLRVDFPAQKNRFYSPFMAEILFDFYYHK